MGLFDKLKSQAPQEKKVAPLRDRLQQLGDQQAVNPPAPAGFPPTGTMCSVCGLPQFMTPSGDTCENGHGGAAPAVEPPCTGSSGHGFGPDGVCTFCGVSKGATAPVAPAAPVAPVAPDEGSSCPVCGKTFKHLSRHKCKGAQEAPASPVSPAAPPAATPAAAPAGGYILIFDALFERGVAWPGWGVVVLFADVIAPLAAAVAKENSQEHWNAVEYGRGPALLAAKLEKWLVATPVGVILADSSTPELRAVKEVLKWHAKAIIQGVR